MECSSFGQMTSKVPVKAGGRGRSGKCRESEGKREQLQRWAGKVRGLGLEGKGLLQGRGEW